MNKSKVVGYVVCIAGIILSLYMFYDIMINKFSILLYIFPAIVIAIVLEFILFTRKWSE